MAATIANWWENRQDRLQYNERLQKYRDTQRLRQASVGRYSSMIGISRKSPIYKDIIFYLKKRLIILKNPKKSTIASRFSGTVKNSFRSKSSVRSSRIRKSKKSRKSSTATVFKKMSRKDKNRYIDGQNAFRFYYKLEITANTVKPGICKGYNKRSKDLEVVIDKKIYLFPGGYYDFPGRCTCGDCFLNGSAENEIELLQKRKILSAFDRDPIKISAETLNLSPVEINNIKKSLQSDGERKVNAEIISKIANNKTRNKLILEKLFDLNSNGIKTIFFACNVAHAKLINAALRLNNIDSGLILGETTSAFRRKQIDRFRGDSSSLNILVNVSVLTTGFDSPNIDCVFISRPVTSIILYSQMIGRGIRGPRMGGNERCKLIEVVDNLDFGDECWAFNFFDSYWSL